jgi:D-amino-acid dehydrogenase
MDLYVPVYPLKGYAMTVSAKEALQQNPTLRQKDLPSRIVCDKYMFTTRLGKDDIRITSIGEFSEWSTTPTPQVDQEFRREASRQFPQLKDLIAKAKTRCGHRPFVNDGILLLGACDTHDNLYVSCGPGSNGWKLALGSGEVIERLVSGQTTGSMAQELDFDPTAFSPAGRVLKAPLFAKLCRARWDL